MDTSHLHPFVLWQGKGMDNHIYRLVDRGPAREHTNESQFIFERGSGHDGMYTRRWVPLKTVEHYAAMKTVVETLGSLLGLKVEELNKGHLIGCDVNMAIIEKRDIRGCDCLGAPGRYGLPDPCGEAKEPKTCTAVGCGCKE